MYKLIRIFSFFVASAASLLFLTNVKAQSSTVVINEIQVAGQSTKDEFIEIYNPTSSNINLTGWRLSKKTKSGNEYNLLTSFPDVIIPAGGYLTVAHNEYTGSVDLNYSTSQSLADNNTLILYSDSGDTIVDLVGWGEAAIYEGSGATINPEASKSLSRQNSDTDNNIDDFIIQAPTPGQANQQTTVPEEPDETATEEAPTPGGAGEENVGNENQEEVVETKPEESSPSFPSTGNIVINELIPNPEGIDSQGEWVELKNIDNKTIDLNNWQLADTSKSYTLSAEDFSSLLLAAGDYLVVPRTLSRLALNNTGREAVSLVDSTGRVIDMVVYEEDIPENQSYARGDGGFVWTTTTTKGSENVITQPATETVLEVEETSNQKLENIEEIENESINSEPQLITDNLQLKSNTQDYSSLIISELLPNPEGDDSDGEWIELYNKGDFAIDLTGVKIGDSSSKVYEIDSGHISARNYYLVHREVSGIALNNNGDGVKLWSPTGSLITSTRYFGTAVSGEAYAFSRTSGLWDWTVTPTPNEANIFSQVLGVKAGADETTSRSPASSYKRSIKPNFLSNNTISLADVKSVKVGDSVATQGVVAVEPTVFGKTYFYIVDGKHGIRVYSAKSDFPALKIGDLVLVSGSLSKSNEELRIKISQALDIQVLSQSDLPNPVEVELSEINESLEGSLVSITGTVTSVKSSNIYIDDEEAEVRVYMAAGTQIDQSIYRSGDKLQVIGLLSETKAGYRIMPRSSDDIRLINQEVAGAATASVLVKNRSSQTNPLVYVYLIVGTLVVVGFIVLNRKYNWLKFFKKNTDSGK